jgi:hypothetical protein
MSMSGKNVVTMALALLVAGAVVCMSTRQGAVNEARAENEKMSGVSQEALQLLNENEQIEKLRAENQDVKRLQAANEELPRLRNEAMQLRHQMEALNKLRAENEDLANRLANRPVANSGDMRGQGQPQKMNFFFRPEALRDAGTRLPIATLRTFFWAASTGNTQRVRDCFAPEIMANVSDAEVQEGATRLTAGFTGYEVTDRKESGDEIDLTVKLPATGQTQEMRFKNVGGEWKIFK